MFSSNICNLIYKDLGIPHGGYYKNSMAKQVEIRCNELGISAIIDQETLNIRGNMTSKMLQVEIENSMLIKADKVSSSLFFTNKKDVKIAIDFLELFIIFADKLEGNKVVLKNGDNALNSLELLRKEMKVSKSVHKPHIPILIRKIDKIYVAGLSMTEKKLLGQKIILAEQCLKNYFK